jgi:hypothetical protein
MAKLTQKQIGWLGCILGVAYGLILRLVFGLDLRGRIFEIMSWSFIFGVPIALGFITVWFGEHRETNTWGKRLTLPWLAGFLYLGCALLLAWEGFLCIILWIPLLMILSSLGGFLAWLLRLLSGHRGSRAVSRRTD